MDNTDKKLNQHPMHTAAQNSQDPPDPEVIQQKEPSTAATVLGSETSSIIRNEIAEKQVKHLQPAGNPVKKINEQIWAPEKFIAAQAQFPFIAEQNQQDLNENLRNLTEEQHLELLEKKILRAKDKISETGKECSDSLFTISEAIFQIHKDRLYKNSFKSFEAYCKERFGYQRAHANRLKETGRLIVEKDTSPFGDVLSLIKTGSLSRPLTSLDQDQQELVLALLRQWLSFKQEQQLSPLLVKSAIQYANYTADEAAKPSKTSRLISQFQLVVEEAQALLSGEAKAQAAPSFDLLDSFMASFSNSRRVDVDKMRVFEWHLSKGCSIGFQNTLNPHAARLLARTLGSKFRGVAREKKSISAKKKNSSFEFTGKIILLPERMCEAFESVPAQRFRVSPLSDLFDPQIPDEFIESVFSTMERSPHHVFQLATQFAERMKLFTQERYKQRQPSENIWLGIFSTSQTSFDQDKQFLLEAHSAVRWICVRPAKDNVPPGDLAGIDWLVLEGVTGSGVRLDRAGVLELRDQCEKDKVKFFFESWGDYGEDGKPLRESKKNNSDQEKAPTVDGKSHQEYPALKRNERLQADQSDSDQETNSQI
jgi:protein gp37